jgi:hypothetical protein
MITIPNIKWLLKKGEKKRKKLLELLKDGIIKVDQVLDEPQLSFHLGKVSYISPYF